MVQEGGRHGASNVHAVGQTFAWPLSLVCGARGDCADASSGLFNAGGGSPTWAGDVNCLPRAAAQCSHSQRRIRVPGDDGAVARRAIRGVPIVGPMVAWKGRRHGRRQERRWARAWSPEQIARRLAIDFPNDKTMRISHEAIYQALFIQGRGALRRELTACLRSGRTLRVPRARTHGRGKGFVTPEIMISQRPVEAADRAVPGHWEGDLILGLGSSAIGTLAVHHAAALAAHAGSW